MPDRQWRLNLSSIWRELGIKGGQQPELSDGPVLPVMVVSNQVSSFASEMAEPRGVITGDVSGDAIPLNHPPEFTIMNRSVGGLVIENMTVDSEPGDSPDLVAFDLGFALSAVQLFLRPPTAKLTLGVANLRVLTVGSAPLTIANQRSNGGAIHPAEPYWFGTPFTSASGWFIPAGTQVSIKGNAELAAPFTLPLPRMTLSLTFREITAIPGAR